MLGISEKYVKAVRLFRDPRTGFSTKLYVRERSERDPKPWSFHFSAKKRRKNYAKQDVLLELNKKRDPKLNASESQQPIRRLA